MSRYRTFKYGTQKYGFVSRPHLSWGFEVDWDNDGVYDGTNEAQYLRKLKVTRGRRHLLKTDGSGFEPVQPGEFVASLVNDDGRFDPYNTSSPLYPNVQPDCAFRLRVRDDVTGVVYPVLAGWITDIRTQDGGISEVVLRGSDYLRSMRDHSIATPLYSNIDVRDAVGHALDAIGWIEPRNLTPTTENLPFWWANGRSAFAELNDLAEAVLGQFFISADGTATFYSRNTVLNKKFTLTEAEILRGIALPQPWDVVRNDIQTYINARTAIATSELWRLRDVPSVAAGRTLTVWANHTFNNAPCPAANVITPGAFQPGARL